MPWPEWVIGVVLLIVSLVALSTCLVLMVKILGSLFQGPVAHLIQKTVNSDLPGVFKYLTGFFAIMVSKNKLISLGLFEYLSFLFSWAAS